MNIANKLTMSRIVLSFICMYFIIKNSFVSLIIAFFIFVIASFTDLFDGLLARRLNIVSDFGKILDPIADKVLTIGVFMAFLEIKVIHAWMLVLIISREFLITGLRVFFLKRGVVMAAQKFGKHKTFSQMVGSIIIFIILILNKLVETKGLKLVFFQRQWDKLLIFLVMLWVVFITIFSGGIYLWRNRKAIRSI